jgi:peptide-methionine (R)-S-oxide reductase
MNRMTRWTRREWIGSAGALGVAAVLTGGTAHARERFPVQLSDAQWRRRLSPAAYAVLRREATERAGTSPLDREKRRGTFHCAGCNQALFLSRTKFDSGTGWPSFWAPIRGAVGTKTDFKIGLPRTEVHCARCGGHLGHVFNDGPRPTGKRYCINGVALRFRPA